MTYWLSAVTSEMKTILIDTLVILISNPSFLTFRNSHIEPKTSQKDAGCSMLYMCLQNTT